MTAEARGRRRGRAETAAAIERAAVDLVLRDGFDHVTVDMICEAAGVSQRTFFNYFKTKDAALLGSALPWIDQELAAGFVTSTGPLLPEALALIRVDPSLMTQGDALFADRLRAVASQPELIARHLERVATVEAELRGVIRERLRHDEPGTEAAVIDDEAEFITNLLAGAMRYLAQRTAHAVESGEAPPSAETTAAMIARVVPRLA